MSDGRMACQSQHPADEMPSLGNAVTTLLLLAMNLGVLIAQIDVGDQEQSQGAISTDGGPIGGMYGRQRTFALGIAVMASSPLIFVLASNIGELIAGRAVTGIAAALRCRPLASGC